MKRFAAIAAMLLLAVHTRPLQAQWRALSFVRDTSYNLKALGFSRPSQLLAGRDGRMLVAPDFLNGDVAVFDSAFNKLPPAFKMGRGSNREVVYMTQWGWVGDSIWILDPFLKQVAFVGAAGNVTKSVGFPSWVRPFWRDRRKYPLFANMTWYAAYPDATLLVEPTQPRRLLDTPGYDPDQRMLVRIDGDGRIVRSVARMPRMDGRFQLRSGTERQWITVPNYPKSLWSVSNDGRRVAVVSPAPADSGAFTITSVNEDGDTLFSKRFVIPAARIARSRVDSLLAGQRAFGRYTLEQVRDTVRTLIPAFYSPVINAEVGLDYSVWVSVRRPTTRVEDAEYFVVNDKGEPQGVVTVLRSTKFVARSLDRMWVIQTDRVKQATVLVRFVRSDAKVVRPSRSARAVASSP
jgi:hypothetical protein